MNKLTKQEYKRLDKLIYQISNCLDMTDYEFEECYRSLMIRNRYCVFILVALLIIDAVVLIIEPSFFLFLAAFFVACSILVLSTASISWIRKRENLVAEYLILKDEVGLETFCQRVLQKHRQELAENSARDLADLKRKYQLDKPD